MTEKRYVRADGRLVWVSLSLSPVRDEDGNTLYLISQMQDVTERKRTEAKLAHQAMHDPLTGLPNRTLFTDRMLLAKARLGRGGSLALLFCDLDDFKAVNDSFGHEAGDRILIEVADRLRSILRPSDTVSRFGGDEFALLCEGVEAEAAERIASRIAEAFSAPFVIDGNEVSLERQHRNRPHRRSRGRSRPADERRGPRHVRGEAGGRSAPRPVRARDGRASAGLRLAAPWRAPIGYALAARKLLQMEHSSPTGAVRFDEHGLVPCVMQDWRTGEVLTLAYMNDEALERTRETGEVHFYSRSRDEIWHKGQTSGNVQRVRQIRYDCDGDALVALVDPAGPACHTGQRSCFYRDLEGSADPAPDAPPADGEPAPAAYEALAALERTLLDRRQRRPDGSYTVELLDDPPRIADKVREEADEVSRAAGSESEERVAEEAADVLYHLHVLLVSRGISIAAVLEMLNGRRR